MSRDNGVVEGVCLERETVGYQVKVICESFERHARILEEYSVVKVSDRMG